MVSPNESLPQPRATAALAAATPLDADPAARSRPRVYLMRGLAQTVSEGVDHLSVKLARQGYRASVHAYGDWPAIAAQIIEDRRTSGGAARAVVVGHSLGANSVVALVNTLAARGVAVDLAVTFDPTVDLTVQGGARQFLNFYQSDNGWGRAVGTGSRASGVENIDLKAMQHLTHFTIDRDAAVHERVLAAIRQIPPRAAPAPAMARTREGGPS